MNVLDLFSGIGGMSLGFEEAGMKTVAFCENDEPCKKVLKKHWPNIPIFEDIKFMKGCSNTFLGDGNLAIQTKIDLICGGFPCQDISIAGNKKGINDGARSSLWKEFKRIIKEVKPRYAIIENVANLRNLGLNQVIKDLWSIGYACEWHIISARSIGACHLRERVWIIAYPKFERHRWIQPRWGARPSREEEVWIRGNGENGQFADTDCNRSKERISLQAGDERKDLQSFRNGQNGNSPDTNMPRLWRAFTSEKEKSEWWAETTSRFGNVFDKINEIEPTICRSNDGISDRLDERARRERVKQLGNSVVPQIPELIGRAILEYEKELKNENF